jgi:hypothetical protein
VQHLGKAQIHSQARGNIDHWFIRCIYVQCAQGKADRVIVDAVLSEEIDEHCASFDVSDLSVMIAYTHNVTRLHDYIVAHRAFSKKVQTITLDTIAFCRMSRMITATIPVRMGDLSTTYTGMRRLPVDVIRRETIIALANSYPGLTLSRSSDEHEGKQCRKTSAQ